MKFSLSLSALVSTLAFTAVATTAAAHPSTVYFFSNGRTSADNVVPKNSVYNVPSLNLRETRDTLSHLLNLGQPVPSSSSSQQEDTLMNPMGPVQQVFAKSGVGRKDLFEVLGGNLMMVIEGVQNVNGNCTPLSFLSIFHVFRKM
jgi:hypothetical protein